MSYSNWIAKEFEIMSDGKNVIMKCFCYRYTVYVTCMKHKWSKQGSYHKGKHEKSGKLGIC